jgi:LL-diaminopimelate aminotransferase
LPKFRNSIANYYKKRFGVNLDPETEVSDLLGSKEGIANLSMAILDPGDVLLYPDPGYPVYYISANFAGADTHVMPLLKENEFLPDFTKIPENIARKAKLMFLNYPNNPTAAGASLDFFKEAVRFAKKYDIIIASDNAYSEIFYDGYNPPSIFEVDGAKDIAIEFFSMSKPYNMTGWRIAACVGNEKISGALKTYKSNIDSGTFSAIQDAAAFALDECDDFIAEMRDIYRKRRDSMVAALKTLGIDVTPPKCTFYIWAPVPQGKTSMQFTTELLDKTGVLVSPGTGFGSFGEGYFRISLTQKDERIYEAVERMRKISHAIIG